MNFGSDYVYVYDEPSFEYISDEELQHGMELSDSDSDEELHFNAVDINEENAEVPRGPSSAGSESVPPPPGAPPALSHIPPAPPLSKRGHGGKSKRAYHWRGHKGSKQAGLTESSESERIRRQVRQGDTNVVTVKFDKLIVPSHMHAGDPQPCTSCGAILSTLSKLETQDFSEDKVWVCEFCETSNTVDLEPEEVPGEADITFMMEAAPSTTASGPTGLDESLVVFCVDVSGSMCVTTEVQGHVELRGAESLRRANMMNRERGDQYLPRQRRNVTYISRLQSVQAAIDHQLGEMLKDFPNRRVALVTFSNEVTVVGDGKKEAVCIAGDKLAKKDTLKTIAEEQAFPDAIKTSRTQLSQKLFELEEGGPTALGPALLVATTMASKVRGSKVILCTDGLANVGMGKLDNFKSEAEQEEAGKFYEELSSSAVDSGVSISVITIKGTDCKLVEIGKLADQTGGQVNIVDPLKLTQEFSNILANKIIATNVEATMILHKELFFFYEETKESRIVKTIGNVTGDTEISFEYGVRTKATEEKKSEETQKDKTGADDKMDTEPATERSGSPEAMEVETKEDTGNKQADVPAQPGVPEIHIDHVESPTSSTTSEAAPGSSTGGAGTSGEASQGAAGGPDLDKEEKKELPFQLQIRYKDTEGATALRVITQTKPVTRDRKKAEKLAKLDVLAAHTARTSAKMAEEGLYTMSRERALMQQRVAWRNTRDDDGIVVQNRTTYKKTFGKIRSMENYLAARQRSERSTRGRTASDDEEDNEDTDVAPPLPVMAGASGDAPPTSASKPDRKAKSKSFLSKLRKKRSETTEDAGAELIFKGKNVKAFFEED